MRLGFPREARRFCREKRCRSAPTQIAPGDAAGPINADRQIPQAGGLYGSRSDFLPEHFPAVKPAVASSATIRADLQDTQDEAFRDSTPVGPGKAPAATTGTRLRLGVRNFHENALL